ncbi:MAG: SDR family NAD(P)-dependent oxidoreductase [Ignavibacteriaceae bacterium]|nr:SDR family NAD(P)-dependent oxidoreductase [Ignavibacteriaceae bacterium]
MKLNDKRAVITGGAMGIGFATAKRLLAEGCTVTIWDINGNALAEAHEELKKSGRVYAHVCDVTDKGRVYELAERAKAEMGGVDILINNAGFVIGGDFLERTDEEWEKTIEINLTSLVYTTRAFLKDMYLRNEGCVVNISSASSTLGVPGLSVYTATKWAVWGLTESLRFEAISAGKRGVKFSSIHPSYIAHGLFEGAKLGFPARLIVPLIKDHDSVAKVIVERAIKKGRYSPKIPFTVNLNPRLRGLLPDSWFQHLLILLGVPEGMKGWKGRIKN